MLKKIKSVPKRKAQGATEYAIFIAAVLAGLLALQVYYSRSVKGNMKGRADSIGEQFDASDEAYYNKESRSVSGRVSTTNTGGDAWSRNDVADNSNKNITGLMGAISGLGVGAKYTDASTGWQGGAVSSTEYVNDDGDHSYYNMTEVSGGTKSVWD